VSGRKREDDMTFDISIPREEFDNALQTKTKKLLIELTGIPQEKRTAAFNCVIAWALPGGESRTFAGELRGIVLEKPAGSGGFGYDPLFMVPEYGRTLAELPLEVKNRISHRGRAFKALKEYLAGS
jgi:XTP/dITP diphosphohydrolase